MRGMMWVFALFILSAYETWSLDTGSSQNTTSMRNTSSSAPKVHVVRNASFILGNDVNLTCSNEPRSEIMFVLWKIELKSRQCRIGHNNDDRSEDSCNDGKSLQNTSTTMHLHIPNFSNDDVGTYQCETIYTGGADAHMINVDIIAPPSESAWLEWKDNKMVAVCKAERGKPAANISWSHLENSSSLETWSGSDGFFTVESRLELPENMDPKNLSCTIRHQSWEGEKTLVPEFKGSHCTWICILTVVISIAVLAGILFLAQKKLTILRCSKQADTSPSKPLPTAEDVEEVEPYASYVQRVNSIYNS